MQIGRQKNIKTVIFLQTQDNFTLPLGLVGLQGNLGTGSISVVLAGVVLAILPSVVLFIFAQRYFIAGITAGLREARGDLPIDVVVQPQLDRRKHIGLQTSPRTVAPVRE